MQHLEIQKFERLRNLLKMDPQNAQLRNDCIAAALQAREYESAVELADERLAQSPADVGMQFAKTNALIGKGDYLAALPILAGLQQVQPENLAIAQNIALCDYCLGSFASARNNLETIYAAGVREAGVVRLLVSSCHHLGLMDRAVGVADENQSLFPVDSALAGVCALVYLDANRAVDAAKCASYSLRGNPNCIDALTVDATLKLATGDLSGAKQEFDGIIARNAKVGRAWVGLGSLALLRRDFEQAKADMARGLEFMPRHVGSWHVLGWTHLVSGNLDEAERVFQHAMELDRNFAETHGAIASIFALRGKVDQANEEIRVALRLNRECMAARFAQSVVASRAGDEARSRQIIQNALTSLLGGDLGSVTKSLAAAAKFTENN
jgi:tetratricopeptide (TPR) repeat protein